MIDIKLHQNGITLIETLVVIAIVTIITSITVPSSTHLLKSWEAKRLSTDIIQAYRMSKIQSVTHHQNVILCMVDTNDTCYKDAQNHLLIFNDIDNNATYDVENDILLLKQALKLDYGRIYLRASGKDYMKFFAETGLPTGYAGHVKYCPKDANTHYMYKVSINHQGGYKYKPHKTEQTNCPII